MSYRVVHAEVGARYGRLTVLGNELRCRSDGRRRTFVLVRCDCGEKRCVPFCNLRSGNTNSCGCLHRERASAANEIHQGKRDHARLYRVWRGMRERCGNPQARNYRWYGAKGIKVCSAWQNDFITFRDWALSHGYGEGLELDREDPAKNYTPLNCRWITKLENIQRRGKPLPESLERALTARAKRTGKAKTEVIVEALEAFLVGEEVSK